MSVQHGWKLHLDAVMPSWFMLPLLNPHQPGMVQQWWHQHQCSIMPTQCKTSPRESFSDHFPWLAWGHGVTVKWHGCQLWRPARRSTALVLATSASQSGPLENPVRYPHLAQSHKQVQVFSAKSELQRDDKSMLVNEILRIVRGSNIRQM